jgi:hypothetical protein
VRRARKPLPPRTCLTAGCGATIPGWKLICDLCLGRLPWQRRRALLDAPPHLKIDEAKASAAWLADNSPAAQAARRMGERID